jgi:hypothetical protein
MFAISPESLLHYGQSQSGAHMEPNSRPASKPISGSRNAKKGSSSPQYSKNSPNQVRFDGYTHFTAAY